MDVWYFPCRQWWIERYKVTIDPTIHRYYIAPGKPTNFVQEQQEYQELWERLEQDSITDHQFGIDT